LTTVVQFSWFRLEGLSLIGITLGIGFLIQIPTIFFALVLLFLNLEQFFIAFFGTIIGSSIIQAAISCSTAEDWFPSETPSLKTVATTSIFFAIVFIIGFFSFFVLETIFPPEISDLSPTQRYFSAMALALLLVGLITVLIYRVRSYFEK
jgi:hypothetical protein